MTTSLSLTVDLFHGTMCTCISDMNCDLISRPANNFDMHLLLIWQATPADHHSVDLCILIYADTRDYLTRIAALALGMGIEGDFA
jgi:hypothetical protein